MSDTKKTAASKTSDPRKGRSKTDQAKTVAETTMAKLAEQKPQDVSMVDNVFNDMVTAKIRMHMDMKRAANVKIDEDRTVLILNPNAIPDKFDFTQEFRVTANDADRKYMVVSNGVIYMYKDENDEPRAIGTASLEALPIVDTWVSDDEANTAPIFGIVDPKTGYEYRSSNFAGLMTLEIHGVDKDGNPAVKKQTRLVLKSARKSINRDRRRYTAEVAEMLGAIRTTPKALAFTINPPKPLSGEAMLIDLGHLDGFRNPKSKFGVTVIPPAGIVADTTKTKTDGKPVIVRDVEVDDVQF